ncbi:MAG TPA: ATP-binding protein [Chthoniobacterales bacterium]
MQKSDPDKRVLLIAPVGQDASAMAQLLVDHGIEVRICSGPEECRVEMSGGAGALLLTEEALEMPGAIEVLTALHAQPAWSELPLIILTGGGKSRATQLLELATAAAGSATLLERPIGTTTLLRSVEVALNSRRRQYQVRDLLAEQRRITQQLREAHQQVAARAAELENLVQLRTAKLAESNQQLRCEMEERQEAEAAREALRRQLVNAQEEERRRIARELHDQMGQNLTALSLGIKTLRNSDPCCAALPALAQPLQDLADQTARDLHRVALELRSSVLDDLGLVKALRNLLETWSASSQIEADFEAGQYNPAGVSAEIKTALYRIIQELLNNIAKHSGATRVSLVLQRRATYVQAILEDDGHGFNLERALQEAAERNRLGLVGIQERLGLIGGRFTVESEPGEGATFLVRIPLTETA